MDSARASFSTISFTRNNFVVRGIELGAQLNDFMAGEVPTSLVRDFIHEVTHHWCFTFNVGYAIAILRLRAQFGLLGRHETPEDMQNAVNDEALVHIARAALDPIAEGLALFAELELLPGARATTPVERWVHQLFLRKEMDRVRPILGDEKGATILAAELDRSLLDLLRRERSTPECRTVRANLLSQPFALEENGHYLLGYTLMRRMERRMRQAFGSAAEPGLVLEWVARFIFDDGRLVALLLGEKRATILREVLDYVEGRLALMASDQALEWFEAFVNDRIARDWPTEKKLGEDYTPASLLGLQEEERLHAMRILSKAQKCFTELPGVDEVDLGAGCWAILMRHVSALGRIEGRTDVTANGSLAFWSSTNLLLQSALDGISPGASTGTFSFLFSTGFSTPCTIITRDDEVVSIDCNARSPSSLMKDFLLSPLKDFPAIDQKLRQVEAWYEEIMDLNMPQMRSTILAKARPEIERIYHSAALGDVPRTECPRLLTQIRESGFYGLLGKEAFNDLVTLGLPGREALSPERIAALAAAGEAAKLPIVEVVSGQPIARY